MIEYSVAGELFGHLRNSLGFGDLTMSTLTFSGEEQPNAIVYKLLFEHSGRRCTCQECVLFSELKNLRSVEAFSQRLSDKWKWAKNGMDK
jgi:hypothetical protein